MLTMDEFQKLPLPKRALLVWNQATFLACVSAAEAWRSLYFLNGYYVELVYNFHLNQVLGVIAFSDACRLEEWLDKVNITELLSM